MWKWFNNLDNKNWADKFGHTFFRDYVSFRSQYIVYVNPRIKLTFSLQLARTSKSNFILVNKFNVSNDMFIGLIKTTPIFVMSGGYQYHYNLLKGVTPTNARPISCTNTGTMEFIR